MKRSQPSRDWRAARKKVELEGVCRNCGSVMNIEAAHVLGREHDRYPPLQQDGWHRWKVDPGRVIPLCGPATDTTTCHGKQHQGKLDVLRLLTLEEQLQAVADAGTISLAARRLTPAGESGEPYRGDFAPLADGTGQ